MKETKGNGGAKLIIINENVSVSHRAFQESRVGKLGKVVSKSKVGIAVVLARPPASKPSGPGPEISADVGPTS